MSFHSIDGFGLFAVSVSLVCYALEEKNPLFTLGFGLSCALGSVYGFQKEAWPFGLVEIFWTVIALQKFVNRQRELKRVPVTYSPPTIAPRDFKRAANDF